MPTERFNPPDHLPAVSFVNAVTQVPDKIQSRAANSTCLQLV
jgi:hypothetical protein